MSARSWSICGALAFGYGGSWAFLQILWLPSASATLSILLGAGFVVVALLLLISWLRLTTGGQR